MVNPSHKIDKILSLNDNSVSAESEDIRLVYNTIIAKNNRDNNIEEAYSIYNNKSHKALIESLLFSDIPIQEISKILDIPDKTINIYKNIFFDISVFKNKIDKLEYFSLYKSKIERAIAGVNDAGITENNLIELECSINALKIMLIYLKLGKKYVVYALGGKDISEDDMVNLIRASIKDAIMSATFNKVLNKEKEAKEWYRTASILVSSLKTVDSKNKEVVDDPLDNIKIKLEGLQKQLSEITTGDIIG